MAKFDVCHVLGGEANLSYTIEVPDDRDPTLEEIMSKWDLLFTKAEEIGVDICTDGDDYEVSLTGEYVSAVHFIYDNREDEKGEILNEKPIGYVALVDIVLCCSCVNGNYRYQSCHITLNSGGDDNDVLRYAIARRAGFIEPLEKDEDTSCYLDYLRDWVEKHLECGGTLTLAPRKKTDYADRVSYTAEALGITGRSIMCFSSKWKKGVHPLISLNKTGDIETE
jgi:hypothetical protein